MIREFYEKNKKTLLILATVFVTYLLYFHNLGNFRLLDVDETRYVAMSRDMFNSKDFLTLYLNGQYFFEKPPFCFPKWLHLAAS